MISKGLQDQLSAAEGLHRNSLSAIRSGAPYAKKTTLLSAYLVRDVILEEVE